MSGPSSQLLEVGDQIAHYRVEAYIARGGMAVIYRARDLSLGRPVALKLIAPELAHDDTFRQRFTRESELAASIDHPHIIPIYQAGEVDGKLYIAMRFVDGEDLGSRLEAGALAPEVAMPIFTQVGGALDAAHAHGLVHRDVKPGNILISRNLDKSDHVYLTDFGLTKRSVSATRYTSAGQFLGTIQYVPPEQIANKPLDARSDVYSLACVMYEAFSGRPPFVREDDAAMLFAHLAEMPAPISMIRQDLPDGVDEALAKALAKEPDARTQTCRELIAQLHSAFRSTAEDRVITVPPGAMAPPAAVVPPAPADATPALPSEAPARPVPSARPAPPDEARTPAPDARAVPPATPAAATPSPVTPPPVTPSPVTPPPVTPPPERTGDGDTSPTPRSRRFSPIAVALSAAAVVGLAAVAALSLSSDPPGAPTAATDTNAVTTTPPDTTSPPPVAELPVAAVPLPAESLVVPRSVNDNPLDLYVVDADGKAAPQRLTTSPKVDHATVLSPDRRTIAYLASVGATATSEARTVVRVMGADGKGNRRFFKSPENCVNVDHLSWNPSDVDELLFICERASGRHALLAVDTEGTVLRTLPIPREMRRIDDPTYSPDGKTIAYWAAPSEGEPRGALFTIAASGSEPPRQLTEGVDDADPAWSAAGDRLAFSRRVGQDRTAIYLIDADGTGERELVSDGLDEKPAWAGEGTSIVYVKRGPAAQTEGDLFRVDADDGRAPKPLNVEAVGFGTPVWGLR
ncbi:MAG: protein kinase domain-containing protein [Actinomycetes bacterium]